MKKLIPLFLILMAYSAFSQHLHVFDVDTTDFPIMRAKFFATDASGNQITNLNESDFKITEDGEERNVLSISCPSPKDPEAISSVLTIDISGSMKGTKTEIAKEAARNWINGLPLGKSECAITSFTGTNRYVQDFTTNRSRLLEQISGIFAGGGTDFDAAFVNPIAGGLLALENAKYKKVMILITDGYASGNENQILSKAQSIGATVYCVTLGYKCPDILKNVAEQTGGMWFENVTTIEKAKQIYSQLLVFAQETEPCQIEWESKYGCYSRKKIEITYIPYGSTTKINCTLSSEQTAKLEIFPSFIRFFNIEPGIIKDTTITVIASNKDCDVLNITSTHEDFDINPKNFKLIKGNSKELTLIFTPKDEKYKFAKINIETNICDQSFVAVGLNSADPQPHKMLQLIHPKGGEKFLVGSDTTITWEGIAPSDTVSIEYSYDDGNSWKVIDPAAMGLSNFWSKIPRPTSNECKVRIKSKDVNMQQRKGDIIDLSGHTDLVTHISWSPDGNKLATVSQDGKCRVWDTNQGIKLYKLEKYRNPVNYISWNPDGSKFATGGGSDTIIIWNASNGTQLQTLESAGTIEHISWSSDGSMLAESGWKTECAIWDVNTGIKLQELKHWGRVNHISWSPDDSKLATASNDGKGRIWDVASGQQLLELDKKSGDVYHISWSPDGSKVAMACEYKISYIFDANNGNQRQELSGQRGAVKKIIWSPDGSMLATLCEAGSVRVWNANSGIYLHETSEFSQYVNDISWSPDGNKVALGCSGVSYIIDAISGEHIVEMSDITEYETLISWSPDGSRLATASSDSRSRISVRIWDASNGEQLHNLSGHSDVVNQSCWSPDGSKVATVSNDWTCRIWDADNSKLLKTLYLHRGNVLQVSWSPDGSRLATASNDDICRIWDISSGAMFPELYYTYDVKNMMWSPDGSKLAIAYNSNSCRIWDVVSGDISQEITESSGIRYVSWSPDGSKVATVCGDRNCRIWNASNGELLTVLSGHTSAVYQISWSPDGNQLATTSADKSGRIWDSSSGLELFELTGHTGYVYQISWSPDGSKLATTSADKSSRIWNASNGSELFELSSHTGYYLNLSWSPDGSMLATAGDDKIGRIWDASSGELLHELSGHTGSLKYIDWNPISNKVVTASEDFSAKIWLLDDNNSYDQEDISDTFSIVAPEISSQDINMGDVVVNSSKDSVITSFIDNIGQWNCRIDSIYFEGADADYFKLNGPTPVYTVVMGESMMSEFKFSPSEVRDYSAQVVVITQADTLYQNIHGRGVEQQIAANSNIIDFGIRELYNYADSTVVCLENVSNNPIDITKIEMLGPDKDQFLFINPAEASPFTLPANTPHSLALRFNPKYIGRTSGQIAFHYNGAGSPAIVQLYGAGIGAELNATSDSAHVGDIIGIEIRLTNNNIEKFAEIIGSFEGVIRVENSILGTLYKEDLVKVEADSAFIRFKGEINPESNIIATIPLKVALGRVEYSSIDFEYVKWFDTEGNELVYDTEFTSGFFKQLGICEQGGKRLYNPEGLVGITSLSPNPAEDKLQLEVNLIEKGQTKLEIYNATGSAVFTIIDENINNPGKRNFNENLESIPSGAYSIILTTPTFKQVKNLIIQK